MAEKWTFLSPVAPRPKGEAGEALQLGRPIAGVRVGLEVDYAWNCYAIIVDEWEQMLRDDGAIPHTLWLERSRDEAVKKTREQIEAEVDEWAKLIDCGLAGLGN